MYSVRVKKIVLLWGIFALCVLAAGQFARAQSSDTRFILTWRAKTFAPPGFTGKTLPVADSKVVASVEALRNGRLVPLAVQNIYWRLNDKFIAGGIGLKTIEFTIPQNTVEAVTLMVELPDYEGDATIETIEIPVARPRVVIDAPYPNSSFSGTEISVRAMPYFFIVPSSENLTYEWTINGESPENAENPEILKIGVNADAPAGSALTIELRAANPRRTLEAGAHTIELFKQ